MSDVRRVDLELHEEQVGVACGDVSEIEAEPAVAACFIHRRRFDRVHGHSLEPSRMQNESRFFEVLTRGDVEARLIDEPATYAGGRIELQRRRGAGLC